MVQSIKLEDLMHVEKGNLTENNEATAHVKFENNTQVEFLIDTGFSGSLCVPKSSLSTLGLKVISQAEIYGIGTHTELLEVAFTNIIWCENKILDVAVYVNEGDDFLLGTQLLIEKELYINYKTGEVLITET